MKKQIDFPKPETQQLDREIERIMNLEFPLPEKAEHAQNAAFAEIRRRQMEIDAEAEWQQETEGKKNFHRPRFLKYCGGLAAAAAVVSGICIVNPAFAEQIPLVGHVFERIGDSLGFSGDYSDYAEPVREMDTGSITGNTGQRDGAEPTNGAGRKNGTEATNGTGQNKGTETINGTGQKDDAETTNGTGQKDDAETTNGTGQRDGTETTDAGQTRNGVTVSLSETYCNDQVLYISMVLKSDEKLPETFADQDGKPIVALADSKIKFSYNDQELVLTEENLDGEMIDEYTYAGVLRYELWKSEDATDYQAFREKRDEFIQGLGVSKEELDSDVEKAMNKAAGQMGVDRVTDAAIAQAGGPDIKDYQKTVAVPERFDVTLSIGRVVGTKPDGKKPEMPEDLRAAYEKAMADNGLSTRNEDYGNFTEEERKLEHELYTAMQHAYTERFPEAGRRPNEYENWWVDGPWEFTFKAEKNASDTIVRDLGGQDESGLGLESVMKTPFEIMIDAGEQNADHFVVALDADGEILPYGDAGPHTFAIQDRDVSQIDVYICDYLEYMNELKGYYWSPDYEEKRKQKTFKQLLDERALYHREIVFEE